MSKPRPDNPMPAITQALVAALKDRFPVRNPSPADTMQTIMHQAGQQSVIEFLEQTLIQQNEFEVADGEKETHNYVL